MILTSRYGYRQNEDKKGKMIMEQLVGIIAIVVLGAVGGIPTLAITASIPAVLGWKIVRMVKEGKSLYD